MSLKPFLYIGFKDPDFNKSNKNILRWKNGMLLATKKLLSPRIFRLLIFELRDLKGLGFNRFGKSAVVQELKTAERL